MAHLSTNALLIPKSYLYILGPRLTQQCESMLKQVYNVCKSCCRIGKYLDDNVVQTLIHAFVTCRMDDLSSLMAGVTGYALNSLQMVPDKLSTSTKQLREKRRQMKRNGTPTDNIEYSEICKAIRRKMKEDIRKHDEKHIIKAIENSKSLKQARQKQRLGKGQLISIMEEDGTHIHDKDRIVKRCVEFYEELYKSRRASADQDSRDDRTTTSGIDAPSILQSEVEASIKRLKRNKAPGEDNITGGILQDGGDAMIQILTDLFNTCLHHQLVPKAWKNALVVLIHKKGNTSDIKNYRPISLLPIMYKVFSNILLQRMIRTLNFHQPREQAGFRAGYSTIDHLQVVNQLQEKANEYNMPLCFAFVDYEKAFDSIEFEPLFEGLKNQGVDEAYVNILRNLYSEATSVLRLHKDSEKFKLGRGARQGDNISPKLFTSCLQHAIINKINWENKGVRIDGEHLSHLIFADDIVLIANSTSKLQDMLQDIHDISKPVGLKMHLGKTKIMCNKHVNKDDVIVDGKKIEEVDSYVYLGQMVTKDHDQIQEMKRRIGQGWSAFCKLDNIMRDKNVPMRLKRKVFNECILPVMTYGCETWSLSNTQLEKLVTTQRKMERIMIGVTLKDRKSTEWIRKQSGLTDIIRSIRESKHRWAGHVARRRDNRWTIRITEWIPHGNKRPRGRPRTRWCDDLIQYVGPTWSHIARDRKLWQACREGFLLRERETP